LAYSGGNVDNPSEEDVSSGNTNHAESIQIEFDPQLISYEQLLEIFWYTHDPTTLNRQGNDIGTQYRSAIFYHSDEQRDIAQKLKTNLENEKIYKDPIVTQIVPFTKFFEAENYHKDYFDKNRDNPYCRFIIDPKVRKLIEKYSNNLKEEYK
jgi:peptide-methionine (S)-S-oxide reductase